MIRLLQTIFILIFLLKSEYIVSQENHTHSDSHTTAFHAHDHDAEDQDIIISFVKIATNNLTHGANNSNSLFNTKTFEFNTTLSALKILNENENSDFSCSGGFCMLESHNHKRGIAIIKQHFDYIITVLG